MDVGMVGRTTLKPRVPYVWLFYLCVLELTLLASKLSLALHKRVDEYMLHIGFTRSKFDSCVYIKFKNDQILAYLLLNVDDMLIASGNISEIEIMKLLLQAEFEMKDIGPAQKILLDGDN